MPEMCCRRKERRYRFTYNFFPMHTTHWSIIWEHLTGTAVVNFLLFRVLGVIEQKCSHDLLTNILEVCYFHRPFFYREWFASGGHFLPQKYYAILLNNLTKTMQFVFKQLRYHICCILRVWISWWFVKFTAAPLKCVISHCMFGYSCSMFWRRKT